ncbi:MAG: Rpn family recombination-promoting nuclease/putative transposase [Treponema sp.]|jgi:predicted transposase/invertase (TIGR01784 family)|nr:Rpn family recombination-promoting nuclease/putative transposase [Treponema sp.]
MAKRILSPRNDFVFKLLFGDQRNSGILADFLKAALPLPAGEYDHLVVVDPHLKREFEDDKTGILDVKVHTKGGIVINVEIQVAASPELRNRIVLYGAKMLTEQVKRGNTWGRVEQVISIVIMNEILVPEETGYYNKYALCNRESGGPFTELLGINILELPKLPKEADGNPLWYWGSFLKCEKAEEFKVVAEKDPGVKKAVAALMELSEDERTQMLQDARDRWLTDHQNAMNYKYRLGKEEGRNEGKKAAVLEIAQKMKDLGIPENQIAEAAGLSPAEIAKL